MGAEDFGVSSAPVAGQAADAPARAVAVLRPPQPVSVREVGGRVAGLKASLRVYSIAGFIGEVLLGALLTLFSLVLILLAPSAFTAVIALLTALFDVQITAYFAVVLCAIADDVSPERSIKLLNSSWWMRISVLFTMLSIVAVVLSPVILATLGVASVSVSQGVGGWSGLKAAQGVAAHANSAVNVGGSSFFEHIQAFSAQGAGVLVLFLMLLAIAILGGFILVIFNLVMSIISLVALNSLQKELARSYENVMVEMVTVDSV